MAFNFRASIPQNTSQGIVSELKPRLVIQRNVVEYLRMQNNNSIYKLEEDQSLNCHSINSQLEINDFIFLLHLFLYST